MPKIQTLTSDSWSVALSQIRLIATDLDGTLTTNGEIQPPLLVALTNLQTARIPVIIVTGRSAGWVSGLNHYLPVVGAIAENGGIYFSKHQPQPTWLQPISDVVHHRQRLSQQFAQLRHRYPQLQPTSDNPFRLTDWTFEITGLTPADLQWLADSCQQGGVGFTYSTVQCHIKLAAQDKATGLKQVLQKQFPDLSAKQILTVGDSPNDESLFDPNQFPTSVGVANVRHYLPHLNHQPAYITQSAAGAGFCEIVEALMAQT